VDVAARVFRLGGEWYFATRDGDIGPFRTREQAKREAEAHQIILKTR
jgi:ATP-dependent RNA circularization protein (DNA/RNA ligase family)